MSDSPDELLLNDTWNLYFHDPYDCNWTYDSYKKLCTVTSAEEFWGVSSLLGDKIQHGMFFLMREHVFPCWDDENNKAGGCLSIKVLKTDMLAFWEELSVRMLSESLLDKPQQHLWSYLNGISTSPKKHFCIIKLWVRTPDLSCKNHFLLPKHYHGDVIYRSNQESIDYDHLKSKQVLIHALFEVKHVSLEDRDEKHIIITPGEYITDSSSIDKNKICDV